MGDRVFWPLALILLGACAGDPSNARAPEPIPKDPEPRATQQQATAPKPEDRASPRNAEQTVAQADDLYTRQMAIRGRDERFAVDRQVTELRRAILLYEQFIERAEGNPSFAEAVRRSQERIVDAQQTIDFLLAADPSDPSADR